MKKIFAIILTATAIGTGLVSCRSNKDVTGSLSYYNFGTTAISVLPSGLITMRAWGGGPDKARAIEEAMKNAVSDVIFKGVKGASGYAGQAIVTEVNARERYAEYFDLFFADGGEYKKFVTETSSKDKSRTRAKSDGRQNFGVTVTVDRNALKQQLRQDGIIK